MPIVIKILAILSSLYGFLTLFPKLFVTLNEQAATSFIRIMQPLIDKGPIPLSLDIHLWHGLVGSVVWFMAGLGLWKHQNWSRLLMALWGLTVLFLTFAVYDFAGSFIWKTLTYIILMGLLFNPFISHYFKEESD